jgi:hypothetical protein
MDVVGKFEGEYQKCLNKRAELAQAEADKNRKEERMREEEQELENMRAELEECVSVTCRKDDELQQKVQELQSIRAALDEKNDEAQQLKVEQDPRGGEAPSAAIGQVRGSAAAGGGGGGGGVGGGGAAAAAAQVEVDQAEIKKTQIEFDAAQQRSNDLQKQISVKEQELNEQKAEFERLSQQHSHLESEYSQTQKLFREEQQKLLDSTNLLKKFLNPLIEFSELEFARDEMGHLVSLKSADSGAKALVFKGTYMHGPVAIKVTTAAAYHVAWCLKHMFL